MFEEKTGLKSPPDDTIIWRYMDFTRLVSILEQGALFFPTIDLLRKIDPWEGSWTNFRFYKYYGGTPELQKEMMDYVFSISSETESKRLCANCWHISPYEFAAMWKLYLTGNEGIAIQTTFGKLKDSFQNENLEWPTWADDFQNKKVPLIAGEVEYIDWDHPPENMTPALKQYIYKGRSFEHEHELRIIAQLYANLGVPPFVHDKEGNIVQDETLVLNPNVLNQVEELGGIYLPVNVKLLIETCTAPRKLDTKSVRCCEKGTSVLGI